MLTQFQRSDLHREWVLNGRPALGLVPFVAPPKMDIKEEIASIASEVHIASDVDMASEVDTASEVDVASEVDTTSDVDNTADVDTTSEADTTSDVDVASESDIADEPAVQKNQKKRKLTHQKSSKEEAAHTGAIRKRRKLNKLDELSELSPAQAFQAIKTNCIDRMVKKQQRRLRRAQKKFLRLNVSRKEAGRRAVLHDMGAIRYSSDTRLAVGAGVVRSLIDVRNFSTDQDINETGTDLLNQIMEAKFALQTLEKMRGIVEESDN